MGAREWRMVHVRPARAQLPRLTPHSSCGHGVQVIIEGFLSYKDQLIADPFSPKINVVGEVACCCQQGGLADPGRHTYPLT